MKRQTLSRRNKLGRLLWGLAWALLYRPSPRPCFGWRRSVLRLFGARVGRGALPYATARIWAPWNLTLGDHSTLGDFVDCYCVDRVSIGRRACVSQYSFLCTASHDFDRPSHDLITAPVTIGDYAWVTADVFVAPGVTVGEGAVVLARSSVFRSLDPWQVFAGSPPVALRPRELTREAIEAHYREKPRSQ